MKKDLQKSDIFLYFFTNYVILNLWGDIMKTIKEMENNLRSYKYIHFISFKDFYKYFKSYDYNYSITKAKKMYNYLSR